MHVCISQQGTAAKIAADKKAAGINPRTNLPYVRGSGSGYQKEQPGARAEARAAKAAESLAAAGEKAANDRAEIARLKGEVSRLTDMLKAAEEKVETVRKSAMLEASQAASEQLLARYREGLRDGASLSRGAIPGSDSGSAAGASPWN